MMSTSRASSDRPHPNQPVQARPPQQERGQRRVDAILAAAAAIVAEDGVQAATMHAIARRSGTTVGSMYHFFPDREAVLVALLDRHARDLGAIAQELTTVDWRDLTLDAVVARFVDTFVGYVAERPDLLPVARVVEAVRPDPKRHEGPHQLLNQLAQAIVAARTPAVSPADRAARASMMLAAVEGVVEHGARMPARSIPALHRELKRMLAAYLGAFESR
jgi:AcrR family transcriptional regulator